MSGIPTAQRDLTGRVFGRLTVIKRAEKRLGERAACWLCLCECGSTHVVPAYMLKLGSTRSCGCLRREVMGQQARRHGMAGTPEYHAWLSAKDRCHRESHHAYRNYGARGITMCDEWRESFAAFFAHVGRRPSAQHSIDRRDNNGHYEPGNVRWATRKEQNKNRRSERLVTHGGRTLTVREWANETGLRQSRILSRLGRGWSVAEALDPSLDTHHRRRPAHSPR